MAFGKKTFTARPKYPDDGAVNARYRAAKPKKSDAPASAGKKKDAAELKKAAAGKIKSQAAESKAVPKRSTAKKNTDEKGAEKKASGSKK